MSAVPLDVVPLWALFLALVAASLLIDEYGFRFGRRRAGHAEKESDAIVGSMVAAELGLLAFLLAFTFGIGASRFEMRRQIMLDETNAIGTTYLRAAMLPTAERDDVRRLLKEYVDVRIGAAMGTPLDEVIRRSETIHEHLWTDAVAAAAQDERSVPVGLFVQSLNDVIDLHAKRVTAVIRSRMPLVVWGVLFAVALLSFLAMGYQAGLTRANRSPAVVLIALTFAAVIWLVADLDRPGQGFLRVTQQPMIDLRNSMDDKPSSSARLP
jgi:hypothetical protein